MHIVLLLHCTCTLCVCILYIIHCRAYGIVLLYIYLVFMVFSVLDEVQVLPIHLWEDIDSFLYYENKRKYTNYLLSSMGTFCVYIKCVCAIRFVFVDEYCGMSIYCKFCQGFNGIGSMFLWPSCAEWSNAKSVGSDWNFAKALQE